MDLKLFFMLAILILTCHFYLNRLKSHSIDEESIQLLWDSWKIEHSKSYSSAAENSARFAAFIENFHIVTSINSQNKPYKLSLNKFADLTLEEFKTIYLRPRGKDSDGLPYCPSNHDCPTLPPPQTSTLNWTAVGAVTPVKDILTCGDVFAFTATAALEALNFFNTGNLVSYSEQQINDCDTTNDGCLGGEPYRALLYTAQYGIETEVEYPYTGEDGKCKYNASLATFLNTGYECVQPKNASQLMSAASLQPVGVCVNAATSVWQLYKSGVITDNCSEDIDYCLALTGFGTYDNISSFYLKNEWGTSWGVEGMHMCHRMRN